MVAYAHDEIISRLSWNIWFKVDTSFQRIIQWREFADIEYVEDFVFVYAPRAALAARQDFRKGTS